MRALRPRTAVRHALAFGAIAVACASPLACGEDDETGDDGGSIASVCDDLSEAFCAKFESCFPALVVLGYGDGATCRSRIGADCEAQLEADGTGFDTGRVEGCTSAVEASTCDNAYEVLLDECATPEGTLADGAACAYGSQCASTYCRGEQVGCGVCTPRIPPGGNCAGNPEACAIGTSCGFNDQCLDLGGAGDACDVDIPCAGLLACVDGTCGLGGGPGASCNVETAPCNAQQQLFCNQGTCAKFEVAGPGEPCGLVGEAIVACSAGGECTSFENGTCAAPGADGEACGGPDGNRCLAPADCADGVCKFPDPASCT